MPRTHALLLLLGFIATAGLALHSTQPELIPRPVAASTSSYDLGPTMAVLQADAPPQSDLRGEFSQQRTPGFAALIVNFVVSLVGLIRYVLRARLMLHPRIKGVWPSMRGNAFLLMTSAVACWVGVYAVRALRPDDDLSRYLLENLNSTLYIALAVTLAFRIAGLANLINCVICAVIMSMALTTPFLYGTGGMANCGLFAAALGELSIGATALSFGLRVRNKNWILICGAVLVGYAMLQARTPEWQVTHPHLLFYGLALAKLVWLQVQLTGLELVPGHGQALQTEPSGPDEEEMDPDALN